MERIKNWIACCGIKLNILKSKAIISSGTKNIIGKISFGTITKVNIGGDEFEYCKTIKNLGITFDETLIFDPHDDLQI